MGDPKDVENCCGEVHAHIDNCSENPALLTAATIPWVEKVALKKLTNFGHYAIYLFCEQVSNYVATVILTFRREFRGRFIHPTLFGSKLQLGSFLIFYPVTGPSPHKDAYLIAGLVAEVCTQCLCVCGVEMPP